MRQGGRFFDIDRFFMMCYNKITEGDFYFCMPDNFAFNCRVTTLFLFGEQLRIVIGSRIAMRFFSFKEFFENFFGIMMNIF